MIRLDYSSFGRFCHCAYSGLSDITSSNYPLGKYCRNMSYDQMAAFYRRFKDAARYICNLDSFLYHLKWLGQDPDADLVREVVLADVFSPVQLIAEECVDELYSRYKPDIDNLTCGIMSSEVYSSCTDRDDDCIPF